MNQRTKLQRFRKKRWLIVSICGLTLSLLGIFLVCLIWYYASRLIYSYAVVIDAGSTSSKIYLYRWPEYPGRINGEVTQVVRCKSAPGISDFTHFPNEAIPSLSYCLENEIIPKIPASLRKKSFVYLGATAGMRMIKISDASLVSKLFKTIGNYLNNTDLHLNNSTEDIKIISGENEGISAWITANYLKEILQTSKLSLFDNDKVETYGTLDLGGASTQITFVPDSWNTSATNVKNIRLYGRNFSVYSHSYLCYGKSQAEVRLAALLLKNKEYKKQATRSTFFNPCMLKDERYVTNLTEVLNNVCLKLELKGLYKEVRSKYKDVKEMKYIGTGSPGQCQDLVNQLFDTSQCTYDSCAFNNVYRPPLSIKYLAFSGFNVIYSKLAGSKSQLSYNEFNQSAISHCQSDIPQVKVENKKKEIWRKWRCFDAIYILTLLKNYGFNSENWKRISFVSKINKASLGWSLGYMIDKTSLIPTEKPLLNFSFTNFIICLLIFLFLIALSFLVLFFHILTSRTKFDDRTNEMSKEEAEETVKLQTVNSDGGNTEV